MRQVVHRRTGFRIDRAHAVIEQHAFVVIHVMRLRRPCEEVPRELHHVVDAAIFGGLRTDLRREHAGIRSPELAIAGATRAK